MILTGPLLLIRTLKSIVLELVAMEALDLALIFLLLVTLLTGLGRSLALLALGFVAFAFQGKVLLILCYC